jgi:cellulose synthase/poly-beta-1,6-N-acetylglucosamine synthase-like glycosyltransferase
LIVPCKGLDSAFRENISSFFHQHYENYSLWFVVAEESDPAYGELCKLKKKLSKKTKAKEVKILIAGHGQSCSQKNHNLLYCYERIGNDIDVMAFADSDICVHKNWLSHLVYPLRKSKYGAASGYRWFVPEKNNIASLALSALNAKVAQLLGNTIFNQAWGGSMAIRTDVFRRIGLDKIWPKVLSDDLSLSRAVKRAGMHVAYVPACLVASYESTTWGKLFEFARRQFLITRVAAVRTWLFGLFSSLFSVLGFWAGIVIAWLVIRNSWFDQQFTLQERIILLTLPAVFMCSQLIRAILRQTMIRKLLEKDRRKMRAACLADVLFSWVWSPVLLFFILSSAFGNTVRWRGIPYKLLGPYETVVLDNKA